MTAAEAPETSPPARWNVRAIASWVLTVLAGIAVTAAVVGTWVHRTVLETDAFMAAVTPALESESVRLVVADRLGDELVEALDIETRVADAMAGASERVSTALVDALDLSDEQAARLDRIDFGLAPLAGAVADGIEERVHGAVTNFVMSRPAGDLLVNVVERAHERTVLLLRDETDQLPNVVIEEGQVRINLVPLAAEALRSVLNAGIGAIGIDREIPPFETAEEAEAAIDRLAGVLGRELDPDFGQVAVMSEAQLQDAQAIVQTFDRLVWALVALAVLLSVLAVALARPWRSGLIRVGVTVAVAMVIGWLAVQALTGALADIAATPEGRAAIDDVVSNVVRSLQPVVAALTIIGIGAAVAGFLWDRVEKRPPSETPTDASAAA